MTKQNLEKLCEMLREIANSGMSRPIKTKAADLEGTLRPLAASMGSQDPPEGPLGN